MVRPIVLAALMVCPGAAGAQGPGEGEPVEVDVELVLAVDVSRSMSPVELEIQRRGYAEAIVSEDVLGAIATGLTGQVAVTYVEWAGTGSARVVVDWTLLATREDAMAFARALSLRAAVPMRRTSISGAIDYAATLFEGNGFDGLRRVIDVSGDGPNNQGRPVTAARDDAVAAGIVINGLPLMTNDGFASQYNLPDLDAYYRNCVIGGPTAFVVPVASWDGFAEAVRRKLVLELVGLPPPAGMGPERVVEAQGYDCLIGERIWQRNQRGFDLP